MISRLTHIYHEIKPESYICTIYKLFWDAIVACPLEKDQILTFEVTIFGERNDW